MKIKLQDVSMTYPTGKKALQNLSMEIESPNLIGLIGPNGAGKSTLMKLLSAGLLPTEGCIHMDGEPLSKKETELKTKLGYLPQSFGLYDELTVWQFLDYMASLKTITNSKQMIEKVIADTNLTDKRRSCIRTLSGGQRQRVGIAQALLGNPELLIFDEPTVGLDPEERIKFRNLFSQMAQNRILILSTHIIEDVQALCNRIIVINHGYVLFDGNPETLVQQSHGHVGVFIEKTAVHNPGYSITSRINTASGIACRIVAEQLPDFAEITEPTLEDAYMYLITKEGGKL